MTNEETQKWLLAKNFFIGEAGKAGFLRLFPVFNELFSSFFLILGVDKLRRREDIQRSESQCRMGLHGKMELRCRFVCEKVEVSLFAQFVLQKRNQGQNSLNRTIPIIVYHHEHST